MLVMNRRTFLKSAGVAGIALPLGVHGAEEPPVKVPAFAGGEGLTLIGRIKTRASREIEMSRIGIGMECLDRRMYLPEKTYGHLAALGAKWARLQTGWARCEQKEGVYDFKWLDEVVNSVIAAGVKPWFNVGYGNKLYSPDAPHESAVGQVPLYDGERGITAWKKFLHALAEHFKDRVSHWEIWNEPNLDCFWHPKHKASATEYTKLVAISAEAIRSAHPDAVIAGCINGVGNTFFEECLKAGIGRHTGVFTFHPYRKELVPEMEYPRLVERMRKAIKEYAPHLRLWQGECGAPSLTKGHHDTWMTLWNMTEFNQAKWLVRRLMLDVFLDLDVAQYFHLCDLMETPYRQSDGSARPPVMLGILNGKTYTPKIAYTAMQSIATLFDAGTQPDAYYYCGISPVSNDGEVQEPYTMLFHRRGMPMLAYYQAMNVQDDTAPAQVDLLLTCDGYQKKSADIMREPVLVDPITQNIYSIPNLERPTGKGQFRASFRFKKLPCFDYPLLITDRSAVM